MSEKGIPERYYFTNIHWIERKWSSIYFCRITIPAFHAGDLKGGGVPTIGLHLHNIQSTNIQRIIMQVHSYIKPYLNNQGNEVTISFIRTCSLKILEFFFRSIKQHIHSMELRKHQESLLKYKGKETSKIDKKKLALGAKHPRSEIYGLRAAWILY